MKMLDERVLKANTAPQGLCHYCWFLKSVVSPACVTRSPKTKQKSRPLFPHGPHGPVASHIPPVFCCLALPSPLSPPQRPRHTPQVLITIAQAFMPQFTLCLSEASSRPESPPPDLHACGEITASYQEVRKGTWNASSTAQMTEVSRREIKARGGALMVGMMADIRKVPAACSLGPSEGATSVS